MMIGITEDGDGQFDPLHVAPVRLPLIWRVPASDGPVSARGSDRGERGRHGVTGEKRAGTGHSWDIGDACRNVRTCVYQDSSGAPDQTRLI